MQQAHKTTPYHAAISASASKGDGETLATRRSSLAMLALQPLNLHAARPVDARSIRNVVAMGRNKTK